MDFEYDVCAVSQFLDHSSIEPDQHNESVHELSKIIRMHSLRDRHVLSCKITECTNLTTIDSKTQAEARHKLLKPMKVSGSVSGDVTINWGGKDGVSISGGASGEVRDDKGNYAKGEVRQNSNGEGSATISAGHREEEQ